MTDDSSYSDAVEVNGTIYVSGASAISPVDNTAVLGRREALDVALQAVERKLRAIDATLETVVKLVYYVTDMSLREDVNAQCREVFSAPRPARSVVGVDSLLGGAIVLIDAIAHRATPTHPAPSRLLGP